MKNSADTFIQRFGVVVTLLTFAYDMCFFFVDFSDKNRDIINMIAGVLNTVCLVTIINFFFGSSKGSKDKQDLLNTTVPTQSAVDNLKVLREKAKNAGVVGWETMTEVDLMALNLQ